MTKQFSSNSLSRLVNTNVVLSQMSLRDFDKLTDLLEDCGEAEYGGYYFTQKYVRQLGTVYTLTIPQRRRRAI